MVGLRRAVTDMMHEVLSVGRVGQDASTRAWRARQRTCHVRQRISNYITSASNKLFFCLICGPRNLQRATVTVQLEAALRVIQRAEAAPINGHHRAAGAAS